MAGNSSSPTGLALVVSAVVTDVLPDGSDGWLSTGAEHWLKCSDVDLSTGYGTSLALLRRERHRIARRIPGGAITSDYVAARLVRGFD